MKTMSTITTVCFRRHSSGYKMLRVTLRAAAGRVADRNTCPASGERADTRRAERHAGPSGRPPESGKCQRMRLHAHAAVSGAPSSSSTSFSSQQSQEETQFSGLALRRGLKEEEEKKYNGTGAGKCGFFVR